MKELSELEEIINILIDVKEMSDRYGSGWKTVYERQALAILNVGYTKSHAEREAVNTVMEFLCDLNGTIENLLAKERIRRTTNV